MSDSQHPIRRVLIASANPLFSKGLSKLFRERWKEHAVVVGVANRMGSALEMMDEYQPDLVILDYDDRNLNREEFLGHYVSGSRPLQLMLVSLKESGAVVVYDRRTLTFSQVEDWLDQIGDPGDAEKHHPDTSEFSGNDIQQYRLPGAYLAVAGQAEKVTPVELTLLTIATMAALIYWAALAGLNLAPAQALWVGVVILLAAFGVAKRL